MKFKKFTRYLFVTLLFVVSLSVDAQHHPRFDTIQSRIDNWEYPSVAGAWHSNRFYNLRDDLMPVEISGKLNFQWGAHQHRTRIHWSYVANRMRFYVTDEARTVTEQKVVLSINPNYVELIAFLPQGQFDMNLPDELDILWFRDANGDRIPYRPGGRDDVYLFDFTHPVGQESIINIVVDAAKTGLYDGAFFDYWYEEHDVLHGRRSLQAQQEARLNILRGIRKRVAPDFLLIGNYNDRRLPMSAPYMNGIFMETVLHPPQQIFGNRRIKIAEDVLRWSDTTMRQPTINVVAPIVHGASDGGAPRQRQQMRLFTTMVLVHSDDSILYNDKRGLRWYGFWDATLGRPKSPKSEWYQGRSTGCYIRDFDNGWAVYNRGSQSQFIELPDVTVAASTGKLDFIHEVGGVDGDIFLRTHPTGVTPRDRLTTTWANIKHQ